MLAPDAPFPTSSSPRTATGLNLHIGGSATHSPSGFPRPSELSQSSPVSRPFFGDSRTSSHSSLGSIAGSANGYYSFATASPTTTSSSSPFSATASPPTLPGLKLPPASPRNTWNSQLSAGPDARGLAFAVTTSPTSAGQPRGMLPPLQRTLPMSTLSSAAPSAKAEHAPMPVSQVCSPFSVQV
jgi:hypothetical protein